MFKALASNPWPWVILIGGAILVALFSPMLSPEEMTVISFVMFSVMAVVLTGILIWLVLGLRQRRKQHLG